MVRCVCGVRKDDGRPMIECEECKVWQHTKCILGKAAAKKSLPDTFMCKDCQHKTVEQRAAAAKVPNPPHLCSSARAAKSARQSFTLLDALQCPRSLGRCVVRQCMFLVGQALRRCNALKGNLVHIQGPVDRSVEVGVAAEHKGDPVGADVADADMADVADEAEDGVTPQKRKTSPQDVVSYSCSY